MHLYIRTSCTEVSTPGSRRSRIVKIDVLERCAGEAETLADLNKTSAEGNLLQFGTSAQRVATPHSLKTVGEGQLGNLRHVVEGRGADRNQTFIHGNRRNGRILECLVAYLSDSIVRTAHIDGGGDDDVTSVGVRTLASRSRLARVNHSSCSAREFIVELTDLYLLGTHCCCHQQQQAY